MEIAMWILLALLLMGFMMTMLVSYIIFRTLLTRNEEGKWGRGASLTDDEDYLRLYAQAEAWREAHADKIREVDVVSDGLHLWGEYFDFGSKKAVIILPGRMESCVYSCHYAEPYRKAGWNVLTVDGRAHGRSEGRINSLGYKEYRDVLAWAKLLKEEMNIECVVLHGICIGSSTGLFASVHPDCPDYVSALVVDGMYQRFYDTCRLHMIKDKRPLYPFLMETMFYIFLLGGANAVTDGPVKRIARMHKPILFLHSREDMFSEPRKAQEMFDKCPSRQKKLVWFDKGAHSKLRLANPERYDEAVCSFLQENGL